MRPPAVTLAILVLLPLAGSALCALMPRRLERVARVAGLATSALTLALAVWLWAGFDRTAAGFQFRSEYPWLPGAGVSLHLGVDGISLPMVLLTALLTLLACVASRSIREAPRAYYALLLLLEAGLLGVFIALDLIVFYLFWEIVLIPMFFLIGAWGGARRRLASVKFFLYTLADSLAMLGGFIALYLLTGAVTFDLLRLAPLAAALPPGTQTALFAAILVALAVKIPVVPLHTWLPDAHVEAPTAVSVLLAGVLLKMGSYGLLRFGPTLLPQGFAALAPLLATLGAVSIVWGAAVALRQSDLKRIVAYSSVSHMGYVTLGIASGTAAGIMGASVQMFSHGLIAGMSFLLVGALYERAHTRDVNAFGGIVKVAPVLSGTLVLAAFASAGLPGLSGFVGEFLVVVGAFPEFLPLAVVAAAAVVATCGYLLWMLRVVVFGPLNEARSDFAEMSGTEAVSIAPLAGLSLVVGIAPSTLVSVTDTAVESLLRALGG